MGGVVHWAEHQAQNLIDGGKEAGWTASTTTRQVYRDVAPGGHDDVHLSAQAQTLLQQPAGRSQVAMDGLMNNFETSQGLTDNRNGSPASAWTYGQAMTAALDQAKLTGNDSDFNQLSGELQKYHAADGPGYCPETNGVSGTGKQFYDDNAWIGLAYMQAYKQTGDHQDLSKAQDIFKFLQTGVTKQGGLVWKQGGNTINTCDMAPSIELALQLHMATAQNPHDTNDQYFQFANHLNNYMEKNLRQPDGLYIDNVDENDSSKSDAIYSYNQGTPIGANTLFYQITGNKQYLDQAQQTAQAAMQHFGQDKLYSSAPAFNTIFLRNLMQLNQVAPNPQYTHYLNQYADHVWNSALNPDSGLFDRPDNRLGQYGKGPWDALDQSALVQVLSIQAMSQQQQADLT